MNTPFGAAPPRRSAGGDRGEDGFTLIELLLVVGIIGILMALSLPTFATAQQKAQHRAAQSTLRNALLAANTAFIDCQSFNFDPSCLAGAPNSAQLLATYEAGPNFVAAQPSGTNTVQVATGFGTEGELALATRAGDGTCWYITQTDTSSPMFVKGDTASPCDATADPIPGTANSDTFPS